jgi:hypothetical protein
MKMGTVSAALAAALTTGGPIGAAAQGSHGGDQL